MLDGRNGTRPHQLTIVALAFANAIKMDDAKLPKSDSQVYSLCIANILIEIADKKRNYSLSKLDLDLLDKAMETYNEFEEAQLSSPVIKETPFIKDKSEISSATNPKEQRAELLSFFKSTHRVDEAYLDDLLGIPIKEGDVGDEFVKMCKIVGGAVAPLALMTNLSSVSNDPYHEDTIAYIFGWLEVYKTHIWHVSEFNRTFFHYGFCLWFSALDDGSQNDHMEQAMNVMESLLVLPITKPENWFSSAQRGQAEARAFLQNNTLPTGIYRS